jgi:hypothetical protein
LPHAPETVPAVRLVAWQRVDESAGHSVARIERLPLGWRCHGTEVLAGPDELLSCWFRVDLDENWMTREVEIGAVAPGGQRTLIMSADGQRRWQVNARHDPELTGCVDVDVAATPLTNTFPIRRLRGLDVGGSATGPIAWVDVPELGVTRVEQTYRRLADVDGLETWEYRDPRHGPFVLTVDADGLVVNYEGFARRVATTLWEPAHRPPAR